jgi:hypothetical protein
MFGIRVKIGHKNTAEDVHARSRRHGMVVGGICADLHILVSSDAEEAKGPNHVRMVWVCAILGEGGL